MTMRPKPTCITPLVLGLLWWTQAASAALGNLTVALEPVVGGLDLPVGLTHAGDGSGRLFALEQAGRIRVVRGGQVLAAPFLDLTSRVSCCGERGLLGIRARGG